MNKPFKPPRVIAEQFRRYEGDDVIPDWFKRLAQTHALGCEPISSQTEGRMGKIGRAWWRIFKKNKARKGRVQ
jgi:hypothetical protein